MEKAIVPSSIYISRQQDVFPLLFKGHSSLLPSSLIIPNLSYPTEVIPGESLRHKRVEEAMDISRMAYPGEERWFACFQGPNNEPYLLVRELSGGVQSSVQLLMHQYTGKVIVRKVPHRIKHDSWGITLDLVNAAHIEAFGEDSNEVRMVKYLTPYAKHSPSPLIYHLIDNRVIEVGSPNSGQFLRESFWKYYNVGNLDDLAQLYQDRMIYPPPSLVARIIHQVLASLQFLLSTGRGVLHRDLHFGNIFVNWRSNEFLPNMYLADFGDAQFMSENNTANRARTTVLQNMILEDMNMFASFLVGSWFFSPNVARDGRFAALVVALEKLRFQDLPAVIQQAKILENASLLEEGESKIIRYFELVQGHRMRKPCDAKMWTCKASAERETRNLPGPFQLIRL